jgi:hypothetical protein
MRSVLLPKLAQAQRPASGDSEYHFRGIRVTGQADSICLAIAVRNALPYF